MLYYGAGKWVSRDFALMASITLDSGVKCTNPN